MDKCRAALILSAYLNLTIQKELINADEPGFGTENAVDSLFPLHGSPTLL